MGTATGSVLVGSHGSAGRQSGVDGEDEAAADHGWVNQDLSPQPVTVCTHTRTRP